MQELLTVPNLLNAIMVILVWSVKSELSNIRQGINEAKKAAELAHGRLDSFIMNK